MSARKKTAASTHRATHAAKAGRRSSAHAGGAGGARRKRWPIVGVGAVVAAALVALVLVSASHSTTARSSASGAAVASAAPGGGGVGSQATSFTLVSLDGRSVSAPRAGRPGVLFFSESSCSSCIPSAQALSSVRSRLGSRVDAVMVDIAPTDSAQYLRQWAGLVGQPSYPLAIDTTGSLATAYQLQYLGTTIFYDAQGRIVARIADPSAGDIERGFHKAGVLL